MRVVRFVLLTSVFVLAGFGCGPLKVSYVKDPTRVTPNTDCWTSVGDSVERCAYQYGDRSYENIILYRFSPAQYSFSLAFAPEGHTLAEWADAQPDASGFINAAYFHEDLLPSGWFMTNGERIGDRAFDWDKTGLIDLTDRVNILDTSTTAIDTSRLQNAFQSYPFLLKNGVPAITEDSERSARRSVLGLDTEGNVYVGIVNVTEMSLYTLAHTLADLPVAWTSVMNLDGGPSSGLTVRLPTWTERMNSLSPVSSVIVITKND